MVREALYDESKAMEIIDSQSVDAISKRLLIVSVEYQDEMDKFLALEQPNGDSIEQLNKVCEEMATYRKALQVKMQFERNDLPEMFDDIFEQHEDKCKSEYGYKLIAFVVITLAFIDIIIGQ